MNKKAKYCELVHEHTNDCFKLKTSDWGAGQVKKQKSLITKSGSRKVKL